MLHLLGHIRDAMAQWLSETGPLIDPTPPVLLIKACGDSASDDGIQEN
jgi:hypothetical protein